MHLSWRDVFHIGYLKEKPQGMKFIFQMRGIVESFPAERDHGEEPSECHEQEESAGKCRNYSDDAAASENGLRARYMNYLDVDDVAVNCPTRCLVLLKMGLVGKRAQADI